MTRSSPLPRTGSRIVLRRLSTSDLAGFQGYRHDKEVGRYQGWSPTCNSKATTFLKTMSSAALLQPGIWCQVGIADRGTDTLIGDIGICVDTKGESAEMGFSLRVESQGRGLGSEAVREAIDFVFEETAITQVICITDQRNLPAIRLLQRISMEHIRTVDAVFRGDPCIEYIFSLPR